MCSIETGRAAVARSRPAGTIPVAPLAALAKTCLRSPSPVRVLYKIIARALLKCGIKGVCRHYGIDLAGEALVEIWAEWHKATPEEKRNEVVRLANQSNIEAATNADAAVREVVFETGAQVSEEDNAFVRQYLTLVPTTVRQSLRQASDPTGKTVPPHLAFQHQQDLLRLLPNRLPYFTVGARPPGVGDWELEELLGIGGFGEVWKARNFNAARLRPVALKFCLTSESEHSLRTEANLLGQVMEAGKHNGIVELRHTYFTARPPCLEYEYIAGGDLAALMRDGVARTPDQVADIVLQLADIVGFAHRLHPPIVHRDLKPANILVQRSSVGSIELKITDFGIGGASAQHAIEATRHGPPPDYKVSQARGGYTPLYSSPQQIDGNKPDVRDDVFSLGVIWYQLLTNDFAKHAPSGGVWKAKLLSQGTKQRQIDLLERCVEQDPDDRPSDAKAIAEQLRATMAASRTSDGVTVIAPVKATSVSGPSKKIYGCIRSKTSGKINIVLDEAETPLTIEEIGKRVAARGGDGRPARVKQHIEFWIKERRGIGPLLRTTPDGAYFLDRKAP